MVSIRPANADDLEPLIILQAEYAEADGHAVDDDIARAGFAPLLADDRFGRVVVADDAGELSGYAVVTWGWSIEVGGLDVVLDEIYVRAKGRGLGSRLLDAVERACRDRGVKRIFLETERPNDGARRLYRRHGFEIDDSIWMSKELT